MARKTFDFFGEYILYPFLRLTWLRSSFWEHGGKIKFTVEWQRTEEISARVLRPKPEIYLQIRSTNSQFFCLIFFAMPNSLLAWQLLVGVVGRATEKVHNKFQWLLKYLPKKSSLTAGAIHLDENVKLCVKKKKTQVRRRRDPSTGRPRNGSLEQVTRLKFTRNPDFVFDRWKNFKWQFA